MARRNKEDPFPDWCGPSAAACRKVTDRLAQLHGMPQRPKLQKTNPETANCGGVATILDGLVRTILSQNTTQKNSTRAMEGFMARFGGNYRAVIAAANDDVADSIRCGGLANVKASRIKHIVASLAAQGDAISLEHLRTLPDAEIKAALMAYPGVGPKTASCVLLFSCGRESFAVDTHVLRISKQLGWIPPQASREQAHAHLDARVPKLLHYPLHVLLVRHGKSCYACAANGRPQRPPLGPCPL